MNLTEIKNASRIELLDYLEGMGLDVDPSKSTKFLRDQCRDLYWQLRDNNGYSFGSIGAY